MQIHNKAAIFCSAILALSSGVSVLGNAPNMINVCEDFESSITEEGGLLRPSINLIRKWREYEHGQNSLLSRVRRTIDAESVGKATVMASVLLACDWFLQNRISQEGFGRSINRGLNACVFSVLFYQVRTFPGRVYRGISSLFAKDGGRCLEVAKRVRYHFRELQTIVDILSEGVSNPTDLASYKSDLIREYNFLLSELEHLVGSILAFQLEGDEQRSGWIVDNSNGLWSNFEAFRTHLSQDLAQDDEEQLFELSEKTRSYFAGVIEEVFRIDRRLQLGLLDLFSQTTGVGP